MANTALSSNEIAQRLGVHITTVTRWFNGSRSIPPHRARQLEIITGIDRRAWLWPDEFFNPWLSTESEPAHKEEQA